MSSSTLPGTDSPTSPISETRRVVRWTCCSKPPPETLITIAADPKPSRAARIGAHRRAATAGDRQLTHHPHGPIYNRTPGGGLFARAPAPGAGRGPALGLPAGSASSVRPGALTPSSRPVCSWKRLDRPAYQGRAACQFFARPGRLGPGRQASKAPPLAPLRKVKWVVYTQTAFWRTPRRCRLPVPLHAPDRYCQ